MGKKIPCKDPDCTKLLGVREVDSVEIEEGVKIVKLTCSRCGTPTVKVYKGFKVK